MNNKMKIKCSSDYELSFELISWEEDSHQLIITTSSKATGKWVDNKKEIFVDTIELGKICNFFNTLTDKN